MKKILALVLVLVLAAATGIAGADTLKATIGTPADCSPEVFKMYFNVFMEGSGYSSFVWEDAVGKEGDYSVYSAQDKDGTLFLNLYALDSKIAAIETYGSASFSETDTSGAEAFGTLFGATLGCIDLTLYVGLYGISSVNEELTNKFTNDLTPLITMLTFGLNDEAQLKNGVAGAVTALGFPNGLEVSGSQEGSNVTLNMRLIVLSEDGVLEVESN